MFLGLSPINHKNLIYFLCRLHQITRQEKNEEKCKKSKKLTKLAIIKSAIQHIKLMQHHLTLQDSNIENGFTFSYSVDQRETLPSIITFPTVTSGESPVGSQELSEDDKLSFPGGTFHSLEMKTEEELEIVNESEGEHEREYVIVEDAEKYQILPVEHQYQIHSNVVYFQGSYSAL